MDTAEEVWNDGNTSTSQVKFIWKYRVEIIDKGSEMNRCGDGRRGVVI